MISLLKLHHVSLRIVTIACAIPLKDPPTPRRIDSARAFLKTARRQRDVCRYHDVSWANALDDPVVRFVKSFGGDDLFDQGMIESPHPTVSDKDDGYVLP